MDSDLPNRSDVFVHTVNTARCPLCVYDIHNALIYIMETVDVTSGFSFSQIMIFNINKSQEVHLIHFDKDRNHFCLHYYTFSFIFHY